MEVMTDIVQDNDTVTGIHADTNLSLEP